MSVITTYTQVSDFLARAQAELECNEILNGLPLGITLNLQKFPERVKSQPYLATVEDDGKLIVMAVMTPPSRLVITSNQTEDFDEALPLVIDNLRVHGWSVPGVMGPVPLSDFFAQTWTSLTDEASYVSKHERLFKLTQVVAPRFGPGSLRIATTDDIMLVACWIKAFQKETAHAFISDEEMTSEARRRIDNGEVYLWVLPDSSIVSMASTTRPMSQVISISYVYTPPELRCHGYATRSVAALSQRLLDSGWKCCSLFTDLSNPTSNAIYQQIGYRPVQDFNEYSFSR